MGCRGYESQFLGTGLNVQPIAIKVGIKFSLDVNKRCLVFGDLGPKGVQKVVGIEILKNA